MKLKIRLTSALAGCGMCLIIVVVIYGIHTSFVSTDFYEPFSRMVLEYGLLWLLTMTPAVCAWLFMRVYGATKAARIVGIVLSPLLLCVMTVTAIFSYANVEIVMSNFSVYDYFNNRTAPFDVFFLICLMGILVSCYIICYGVAGLKLRLALRLVLYAIIGLAIWFSLRTFVEYPLAMDHLSSYDITQHDFREDERAVTSTSLPGWAEYTLNMGIITTLLLCDRLTHGRITLHMGRPPHTAIKKKTS